MEREIGNRRRHARATGPMVRRISALVRPGRSVLVLDLSATGALVAALRPLRPGAAVHVHFEADGDKGHRGAVVARCLVAAHGRGADGLSRGVVLRRAERMGEGTAGTSRVAFSRPAVARVLDATVNAIPDAADSQSRECGADDKWFEIPQSA